MLCSTKFAKLLSNRVWTLSKRTFASSQSLCEYNRPLSGKEVPRSGGIASMFRLPIQDRLNVEGLDACFLGIPLDIGVSNRSGTRLGPRQIRTESALIRETNMDTGAKPFDSLQVADVGDIPINLFNLPKACEDIRIAMSKVIAGGCKPLVLGGDHTLTYPVLQAIKEKHGPVGLVHIDAHSDTSSSMLGEKIAHGTPFYRAVEEGLLHCKRVVQIGLRGSTYGLEDFDFAKKNEKHGPVGLVHIDAHSDTSASTLGEKIAHGTPFYRAVDEGLLDCKRVVQIGLRGSRYGMEDFDFAKNNGFRLVYAKDCWHKSLTPLMEEVREQMGDGPVYISFDIDGLDPAFAPGTGTPEVAGLTSIQGLEIVRGCRGMNVIGGDLVEVSPMYDVGGRTALTGANLLFEMLCVLPGVKYV